MPLFSLIIPVFNRASLVFSTLDTVIKQKYNDFEIILVDDGSTDDIKNKLSNYINNGTINYYYQSNAGVSAARNKGASYSQSEYLIFLDSDDFVTENWLLDFSIIINNRTPDIIYCGLNRCKDNIFLDYTDPTNPYKDSKSYGNVIPGSFCIKKKLFDKVGGYDEQLSYGENTELGFRIKMTNPSMAFIKSPNLIYNFHYNSHGKNARNKMNSIIYTINKHPQIFRENKGLNRRFLSIAGVSAASINEIIIARELFWKAWKLSPLNSISFLRYIFSFSSLISKKIWVNR
jgi:glycosyltransferase involved in cell wall biosynthesis